MWYNIAQFKGICGDNMKEVIDEISKYILDNLYDDITLEQMEKEFFYSKYHIIRIFKQYTGFTIKEFINNVKVLKTVDPLLFTDDTILKIALNHGFNSQEYYSEKFQDVIGMPPLKFRKEFSDLENTQDKHVLKLKKEYLDYLGEYQDRLLNIKDNPSKENGKIKQLSIQG